MILVPKSTCVGTSVEDSNCSRSLVTFRPSFTSRNSSPQRISVRCNGYRRATDRGVAQRIGASMRRWSRCEPAARSGLRRLSSPVRGHGVACAHPTPHFTPENLLSRDQRQACRIATRYGPLGLWPWRVPGTFSACPRSPSPLDHNHAAHSTAPTALPPWHQHRRHVQRRRHSSANHVLVRHGRARPRAHHVGGGGVQRRGLTDVAGHSAPS